MASPWAIDLTPERSHVWLSEDFSVPSASLCLDRPEAPNGDFVCCAVKGHAGRHDHRWLGDRFPAFRPRSVREEHEQAGRASPNAEGDAR